MIMDGTSSSTQGKFSRIDVLPGEGQVSPLFVGNEKEKDSRLSFARFPTFLKRRDYCPTPSEKNHACACRKRKI